MTAPLVLRPLGIADEAEATRAHEEMVRDGFTFLWSWPAPEYDWAGYIAYIAGLGRGEQLPEGHVPSTFLVADVDGELVGRISIRHELNDALLQWGGHVGYGVRPRFRRRGYASQMLARSIARLRAGGVEDVLVTCADDNLASAATIERAGGVLENVVVNPGGRPTRRYWIPARP